MVCDPFNQDSSRISSLAHYPGPQERCYKGDPEGSQGEQEKGPQRPAGEGDPTLWLQPKSKKIQY